MRKKGIALLAALLRALLAGCGANGAAQPEQIDEPAVDPNLSPTAAFMAALQEDEVTKVALCGGQLAAASPAQMWKALNNAATHEITESEACYDLGYSVSGCQWEVTVSVPADVLRLSCGLAENVVVVQSERLSARESCQRTAYFNDSDLYELVRCSRDGSTRIDQSAYEAFQSQVDEKLQALLAERADDPAGYDGCVLTGFAQVWQYETGENRADWYRLDGALTMREPEKAPPVDMLALDSQMRLPIREYAVARYQGDTLLGLVFLDSTGEYHADFPEDRQWVTEMFSAVERVDLDGSKQRQETQQQEEQRKRDAMALRLMAALRPEDIYELNTAAAADVTAEQLAAALNGAAEHNISQEAALAAGYDGADRYVTFLLDQGEVYVSAGEPQNIVQVMVGLGTVYYKDAPLYALLRGR